MPPFGQTFHTRKEAKAHLEKLKKKGGFSYYSLGIRKLSKKAFPRRKKLYHVGTEMDYLNFD